MKNLLFIDFAETLGYRPTPESDTDFEIIQNTLKETEKTQKAEYLNFLNIHNLYDRTLTFRNFEEEKGYTIDHFYQYLSLTLNNQELSQSLAKEIANQKYNTISHALFADVQQALYKYRQNHTIYIISDGRPSRRITLKLLGLEEYCEGFFISDELGMTKDNVDFYKQVLDKTGITKEIIFIDDQVTNLDTFSQVTPIKGILIDRKGDNLQSPKNYTYSNKLPSII